jgi:hypothetical protein
MPFQNYSYYTIYQNWNCFNKYHHNAVSDTKLYLILHFPTGFNNRTNHHWETLSVHKNVNWRYLSILNSLYIKTLFYYHPTSFKLHGHPQRSLRILVGCTQVYKTQKYEIKNRRRSKIYIDVLHNENFNLKCLKYVDPLQRQCLVCQNL